MGNPPLDATAGDGVKAGGSPLLAQTGGFSGRSSEEKVFACTGPVGLAEATPNRPQVRRRLQQVATTPPSLVPLDSPKQLSSLEATTHPPHPKPPLFYCLLPTSTRSSTSCSSKLPSKLFRQHDLPLRSTTPFCSSSGRPKSSLQSSTSSFNFLAGIPLGISLIFDLSPSFLLLLGASPNTS